MVYCSYKIAAQITKAINANGATIDYFLRTVQKTRVKLPTHYGARTRWSNIQDFFAKLTRQMYDPADNIAATFTREIQGAPD